MWHLRYGSWWMVQWALDGWLSLGIHVDLRTRRNAKADVTYGPYVDLHLGFVVVSLGRNPAYSSDLDVLVNFGRGGAGIIGEDAV